MLDREGNRYSVELLYKWDFGNKQYLVPSLEYHKFDLDGDARANDRYGVKLTYGYKW